MCPDSSNIKFGRMSIRPGLPIDISDQPDRPVDLTNKDANSDYRSRVGKTLKAYLLAVRDLLDGKFKNLRDIVPIHMTDACLPHAFIFSEGVIVRYDLQENPDLKVLTATPIEFAKDDGTLLDTSLLTATSFVSENFLHCVADPSGYDPGPNTPSITISIGTPGTDETKDIAKHRIFAVTQIPARQPDVLPGLHPVSLTPA